MAKRKRTEDSEEVTSNVKKQHQSKIRVGKAMSRAQFHSDHENHISPHGHAPISAVHPKPSTKLPNEAPKTPPGLSKRQRRRWQRKQKRLTNAGTEVIPDSNTPPSPSRSLIPAADSSPISKPTRTSRTLLLDLSRTPLIVRKPKVWRGKRSPAQHRGKLDHGKHVALPSRVAAVMREEQRRPDEANSNVVNASVPSIKISRATAVDKDDTSTSTATKSSDAQGLRFHIPLATRSSIRRMSFNQKPNSVPSVTIDKDPAGAFKRFSAFLNKGKTNESNDDSFSSESESDEEGDVLDRNYNVRITTKPKTALPSSAATGTVVEQRSRRHASSDGSETNRRQDSSSSYTNPTEMSAPDSDEESMSDKLQLPTLTRPRPFKTRSSPIEFQRGNADLKSKVSFSGRPAGGLPSGNGSAPAQSPDSALPADPWNVSEADSKVALQIMDEISESMLLTTRPLPVGEFGTIDEVGGELSVGTLTQYASFTQLKGPPAITTAPWSIDDMATTVPGRSAAIVCNSVQVPDKFCMEVIAEGWKAPLMTSDTTRSSKIVDATSKIAIDDSDSSSPLSELAHTPSAYSEKTLEPHQIAAFDEKRSTDAPDAVASASKDGPSPAKKRKMTGRTSKHFSPIKQPKGRQVVAAVIVEGTSTSETMMSNGNKVVQTRDSRAENAMNSKFRAEEAIKALREPARSRRRVHDIPEEEYQYDDDFNERSLVEPRLLDDGNDTATSVDEDQRSHAPNPVQVKKKRKSTGKKSTYFTPPKVIANLDPSIIDRVDFYNTTSSARKARVPAGTSTCPFPPIHSPRFGIIQEKLWQEPFWLLIAVTLLNKTTGRAAVPTFWGLKEKYATAKALAEADQAEVMGMVQHLGFQRQRSRRLIKMAAAWVEEPPVRGRRRRCMHYPEHGDGKGLKPKQCLEEDADDCVGALEIAHIPGCGRYAWDSWRIFCRDALRGVAKDYNGLDAEVHGFVPEWKKVLPGDKELRACLRWMWLREGWIWNHETGERRKANDEEMERAVRGEVDVDDPVERKLAAQAAQAAGVQELVADPAVVTSAEEQPHKSEDIDGEANEPLSALAMPVTSETSTETGSNIIVTPLSSREILRRQRLTA